MLTLNLGQLFVAVFKATPTVILPFEGAVQEAAESVSEIVVIRFSIRRCANVALSEENIVLEGLSSGKGRAARHS